MNFQAMSFQPVSGSDMYGAKRIPLGGEKKAPADKPKS